MYLLHVTSPFYLSPVLAHFHAVASRSVSHVQDNRIIHSVCDTGSRLVVVVVVKVRNSLFQGALCAVLEQLEQKL